MWGVSGMSMSGCLYTRGHLYVLCTSRGHLGRPSVHLSTCQALLVSSCITVGLSYQLINMILGHIQSHIWLAWKPIYCRYCFLWMCAWAICCKLVLIVLLLCSVFIMSQTSATAATMTTPPMTVVWSGTPLFL